MAIVGAILIIVACLAASAFFSGSETALFRLRAHDLDGDDKEAIGPADAAVRDLTQSSSRLLVTILLGNNVVNILGAAVASGLAIHYLGVELGIPVATFVMTGLVLVLCEILPKAIAARHPRGVSRAVGLPLYLFHKMLRPIHGLFDRVIEPLVRRVTGGIDSNESMGSEEVLRLAREALQNVDDAGSPLAIIGATSNAAEMDVSEIMVPRTEIEAYPTDTPVSDLIEKMLEGRYTRVPIYEDTIDHVLGVIHLKDLIKLARADGKELFGIVKPVLRVPERKPILRLLTEMQRAFCHVALVKDEFGVTQGLVTQEDILEEIVGEIRDEFDSEELLMIRKLRDGSHEVLGRIKVLDFNRETGWQVPAEKGDTIGGLIFNTLERAPRNGEWVDVPGYRLECIDVSGSRITRVRIIDLFYVNEEAGSKESNSRS
ncbi:MAG TPA: HlyC/CorC family transporter [Myxococcales bacterium]|nr:HlyC/CorC family transporter [Myxococcales bacterium]HIK83484.1 HlyC/CorC family transporter [Myxococcales bacterium]